MKRVNKGTRNFWGNKNSRERFVEDKKLFENQMREEKTEHEKMKNV
jgi:hypothetical protein